RHSGAASSLPCAGSAAAAWESAGAGVGGGADFPRLRQLSAAAPSAPHLNIWRRGGWLRGGGRGSSGPPPDPTAAWAYQNAPHPPQPGHEIGSIADHGRSDRPGSPVRYSIVGRVVAFLAIGGRQTPDAVHGQRGRPGAERQDPDLVAGGIELARDPYAERDLGRGQQDLGHRGADAWMLPCGRLVNVERAERDVDAPARRHPTEHQSIAGRIVAARAPRVR